MTREANSTYFLRNFPNFRRRRGVKAMMKKQILARNGQDHIVRAYCISGRSCKIFKQVFRAPSGITEGFTSPSNVPYWQQLNKEAPSATSDRALNNYLMFSNIASQRVPPHQALCIVLYGQEPIKAPYDPKKFGGYVHSVSGAYFAV